MRRTKEEAEQTKHDIMDAATEVFVTKGFSSATLEEIARKAGVTRGAIYWHFKNKVEIFDCLYERIYDPVNQSFAKAQAAESMDPILDLKNMLIHLISELDHNHKRRQALQLVMIHFDYSGHMQKYEEKHRKMGDESIEMFFAYFDRAAELGKLPAGTDLEHLKIAFNCFLQGILYDHFKGANRVNFAKHAKPLMDIFFAPYL